MNPRLLLALLLYLSIPAILAFIVLLSTIANAQADPLLPPIYISPALNTTNYQTPPFSCVEGYGPIHLAHYQDKANNTVDIWCMWMPNNGATTSGGRGFVAFYNNATVIGMCPYEWGQNSYAIMTDEHGVINATGWLSIDPNRNKSTQYNMTFNQYNATEAGVLDRAGLSWLLYYY